MLRCLIGAVNIIYQPWRLPHSTINMLHANGIVHAISGVPIEHLLKFRDGAFGVGDFESEIEQLFKSESLVTSLFTSICLLVLCVFLFFFFLVLCWVFLCGVTSGCCGDSLWDSVHTSTWVCHAHWARWRWVVTSVIGWVWMRESVRWGKTGRVGGGWRGRGV